MMTKTCFLKNPTPTTQSAGLPDKFLSYLAKFCCELYFESHFDGSERLKLIEKTSISVRSRTNSQWKLGRWTGEEFNLGGLLVFMKWKFQLLKRWMISSRKPFLSNFFFKNFYFRVQGICRLEPIILRTNIGSHFSSLNAQTPLLQASPHLLTPCQPTEVTRTNNWLSFIIQKHKNTREVIFLFGSIRNTKIRIAGVLRPIRVQTKSVPEDPMTFH